MAASLKRRIAALEQEAHDLLEALGHDTEQTRPEELALLLLAELGDVRRFASAAKLVAFAGLTPQQTVSGTSVNRTRLSKLGSSRLRRLLDMPGLVAVRHNPPLKRFYERLLAHGKSKKTALAAAMAKLLRIVFGVLTHRLLSRLSGSLTFKTASHCYPGVGSSVWPLPPSPAASP